MTPPSSVLGSASAVGTPASPRTARPIAPGPESVVAGRRPGAAQTGVMGSVLIPLLAVVAAVPFARGGGPAWTHLALASVISCRAITVRRPSAQRPARSQATAGEMGH